MKRWLVPAFLLCVVAQVMAQSVDAPRVLHDVSYKTGDLTPYEQQRCRLDLYLPEKPEAGFATIVWFHGGSIQGGDKASRIETRLATRFAREGVAVASVNYRLHPKVMYPAYLEDAAAAFAFVHRTIAEHGGSADRVFLSGHSAGGYLSAMVGMDEHLLAAHQLKTDSIAGLMPVSGQMITHSTVRKERGISRLTPIIDAAAPLYHARENAPPCLAIAGSKDLPGRSEENRYFVAALKAAGHPDAAFFEGEGRDHGTIASRANEADDVVAQAMLAFIRRLKR